MRRGYPTEKESRGSSPEIKPDTHGWPGGRSCAHARSRGRARRWRRRRPRTVPESRRGTHGACGRTEKEDSWSGRWRRSAYQRPCSASTPCLVPCRVGTICECLFACCVPR
eukprot:2690951-Rhodomonas_salina.6